MVYFAPIEDYTENCSCSENVLDYPEFAKIHLELVQYAKQLGFSQKMIISFPKSTHCGVNANSDLFINSKGNFYKCEHLMSLERDSVGNVFDGMQEEMIKNFTAYTPFDYEECRECAYLPKCWGGCMFKRIYLKRNWCPYWKHSFKELAKEEYKTLEGQL